MATPGQMVAEDSAELQDIEAGLVQLHGRIASMVMRPRDYQAAGIIGANRATYEIGRLMSAAGDVGRALATIGALHMDATDTAREKGIDIPAPRSGGDR